MWLFGIGAFVYLCICVSVHLSVWPIGHLSICVYGHVVIWASGYLGIRVFVHLSIHLAIRACGYFGI